MRWAGAAVFLIVLTLAAAAGAQGVPESQSAFEHRLFVEAGFTPIQQVRASGMEVRRVLLRDPYGFLPVPGLELQRRPDGGVWLRLQYYGWSGEPVAVDRKAWDELAALEQAAFARPVYAAPPPRLAGEPIPPPPPPPPICHGWLARLEADETRSASWGECGGQKGPAHDYVMKMVAIAMTTRPDCAAEGGDPFFAFNKCLGPKPELDDARLEAKFAVMRQAVAALDASKPLMAARSALMVRPLYLGSPAWKTAREAVARYKAMLDERRWQLQSLQALASGAMGASQADKVKMKQAIDNWSSFLASQETNYSRLLFDLVSAPEPRPDEFNPGP